MLKNNVFDFFERNCKKNPNKIAQMLQKRYRYTKK
tara:strand:- start:531 stop:635 length:105 start_codon:yes stop_codon:yes gene_type:complete